MAAFFARTLSLIAELFAERGFPKSFLVAAEELLAMRAASGSVYFK
jgi:hypothetical protein